MKKFLPVLAILVVVGIGWFLLKGSKEGGGISLPGISKTYTVKGIKAIVDLGIPMKCSYKVGEMEAEGYVKGRQWRGSMQFADGRQGEIIMKNDCMWSWTEDKQGVKMCFEPTEEDKSVWDNPEDTNVDLDYKCRPAAITDDKFNLPADVNFMELDQMMGGSETFDMSDIPDASEMKEMQFDDMPNLDQFKQ